MLDDLIQLQRSGRLEEAEHGYRELLRERPDDPELLHLLGILRGQRGDLSEALALVTRAGELDPYNATCQYTLGEMYLHDGQLERAREAYRKARELNPNLSAAHSGLGQVALLQGDLAAAEEHFRVALRADENDAEALAGLGNVHLAHGDPQMALRMLTRALELDPDNALVQTSYGQAMLDQGMTDFAARALDNALALKPDFPLAQLLRAQVQFQKGEVDAARAGYERLLLRGEQMPGACVGLGDIARAQNRHDEAIARYDEALRQAPSLHVAAIRRADSLARSGRADRAIEDLRAHIARHPDSANAHIALAHLLSQRQRHDEALAVWREAEARWPDNIDLKAQHALALDRAGRPGEAVAHAELAAASPRPALALLRARGALLAGDPAAAVQRLLRIDEAQLQNLPRLARRRQRLLGLACDALEQWQDAVRAFEAAQRLSSGTLPELPVLNGALQQRLRDLAKAPALSEPRATAPVFLCGLPGSGVGQVAALLADQPGWVVRRDRFTEPSDFLSAPFDPRLEQPLDQAELSLLARRYRKPLQRAGVADDVPVIDWLPVLDARMAPAIGRALPGARLIVARRDLRDTLLDWLGHGWAEALAMPDAVAGAHWLRLADAHLRFAAELLTACVVDADALLGGEGAESQKLAGFLGVAGLPSGPAARAAASGRGGLPTTFPAGHAAHYHDALSEAFAVLEDVA